jgi:hypothetical protein
MGNSVIMAGSGELDNGMTVSISFEMDQGTANNSALGFDNHSVSIGSDALGTLVLIRTRWKFSSISYGHYCCW